MRFLKSDLTAQGVRFDNVNDLILLLLAEMRSTNLKVAYGIGAGGMALGINFGLLIPLIFLHLS